MRISRTTVAVTVVIDNNDNTLHGFACEVPTLFQCSQRCSESMLIVQRGAVWWNVQPLLPVGRQTPYVLSVRISLNIIWRSTAITTSSQDLRDIPDRHSSEPDAEKLHLYGPPFYRDPLVVRKHSHRATALST